MGVRAWPVGYACDMRFSRRKSRMQQVTDLLATYLKFKAAAKAAKGAKKAAKGTAAYQAAKRTPVVKRLPLVAGAGVAAFVASRVLRHDDGAATA
jgi:hypothetical protein